MYLQTRQQEVEGLARLVTIIVLCAGIVWLFGKVLSLRQQRRLRQEKLLKDILEVSVLTQMRTMKLDNRLEALEAKQPAPVPVQSTVPNQFANVQ